MNRQDAKKVRYEAPEIRSEFSQTGPVFYLTWRSWRLGGENLFTLPHGVTLAKQGFAVEKQSVAVEGNRVALAADLRGRCEADLFAPAVDVGGCASCVAGEFGKGGEWEGFHHSAGFSPSGVNGVLGL